MKTFFITAIVSFISVIGFNFYIDKNFFWYRHSAFEKLRLEKGQCLKFSGEKLTIGDRQAQAQIRKYMPKPDLVVFSSSRGAYSDYTLFQNKTVYNSASSITLLEDFLDAWVDLKRQRKIPTEVVIFLDGWIFNEAVVNFRSWNSLPGFMEFLKENNLMNSLPAVQAQRYKNETRQRLKLQLLNLISLTQTKISFDLFLENDYKNFEIKPCESINDNSTYMSWMGAHISKNIITPDVLEERLNQSDAGLVFIDPWLKSDFLLKVFKGFIEDLKKHNIKIHIVTPLTHPKPYAKNLNKEGVKEYKNILADLKKIPELHVCEVFEAKEIACGYYDFKDAIHMTQECTGKLLRHCGIIK